MSFVIDDGCNEELLELVNDDDFNEEILELVNNAKRIIHEKKHITKFTIISFIHESYRSIRRMHSNQKRRRLL